MDILCVDAIIFYFVVRDERGTWPAQVRFEPVKAGHHPLESLYSFRVYYANLEIGNGSTNGDASIDLAESFLRHFHARHEMRHTE
jgi:hypothetical protein